jgi:hypothetical protein
MLKKNLTMLIGIIFFKFDSMEEMLDMMDHSDKWINVIVE